MWTLPGLYPQHCIAPNTFQRCPCSIPMIGYMYRIRFTYYIGKYLQQQVLKQWTSSNALALSITWIRPPFSYLQPLITLLLPNLTMNFVLSASLRNSLPTVQNFCETATSASSSTNNCWFISKLTQFELRSYSNFQNTLTFTCRSTWSMYTLNNNRERSHSLVSLKYSLETTDCHFKPSKMHCHFHTLQFSYNFI